MTSSPCLSDCPSLVMVFMVETLGIIAFFIFSNPLGKLVQLAIESFGPDMVQAEVSVNSITISACNGYRKLNGLKIGNSNNFEAIQRNIGTNSGGGNSGQLTRAVIHELNARLAAAPALAAATSATDRWLLGLKTRSRPCWEI